MDQRKDRRVRKTRKAVHEALLSLMEHKDISDITIVELTEKADINRKTFYNHYSDIYAVLNELEDECIERFTGLLEQEDFSRYIEDPTLFFTKMIMELKDNDEFYMLLNRANIHSNLTQKLITREKEILHKVMGNQKLDEIMVDYFLMFISSGTMSVIKSWYMSDRKVSIDTLAEFFNLLFSSTETHRYLERVGISARS